jgi:hypothetical protein
MACGAIRRSQTPPMSIVIIRTNFTVSGTHVLYVHLISEQALLQSHTRTSTLLAKSERGATA